MNKQDLEKLLKEESASINIEMSKKLINTPIVKSEKDASYPIKRPIFHKFMVSVSCCLALIFAILGVFILNKDFAYTSNLTSYIMEINPSICITADNKDEIINVCSLNVDGDEILSSEELNDIIGLNFETGVNKVIGVIYNNGYFNDYQNTIKLYAINDDKEIRNKKITNFENIFQKNLNDLGMGDIPFEKHEMEISDFKEKLGFEEDFKKLDDMFDYLKGRDKHHVENPKADEEDSLLGEEEKDDKNRQTTAFPVSRKKEY